MERIASLLSSLVSSDPEHRLTLKEVATELGVTRDRVLCWTRGRDHGGRYVQGVLRSISIGDCRWTRRRWLEEFLDRNEITPPCADPTASE